MPTVYGVTAAGFIAKSLPDIKAEYEGDLAAGFGTGVNLEPESVLGQLVGIFAERDAEIWEALLAVSASMDPDQATDAGLDTVMGITGTIRHGPSASTASVIAVGATGTTLTTGRVFSVTGSGVRFASTAAATLAAATAWAPSTPYATGALVANAGNIYYSLSSGVSAGSGGPTGSGLAMPDGGTLWRFLGAGGGAVAVPVTAQASGPKPANAWALSTVETAVAGLDAVSNPLDAALGRDIETDAAARQRRDLELQNSGLSTVDAIRGNLLQVPLVTQVYVYENTDPLATNADGMPPNSVEAVVQGGADATVRSAVFASVGGGIAAFGTNTGAVVDSEGISHQVAFTRPGQVLAYLDVTVSTNTAFPSGGIAQIKAALVAWGLVALQVGAGLHQSQLYGPIFTVPGVTDVPQLFIGTTAWPTTGAAIVTASRQQVVIDTGRIRVNGT